MFGRVGRDASCKAFLPADASETALCMPLSQAAKAAPSSSGFAREDGEC